MARAVVVVASIRFVVVRYSGFRHVSNVLYVIRIDLCGIRELIMDLTLESQIIMNQYQLQEKYDEIVNFLHYEPYLRYFYQWNMKHHNQHRLLHFKVKQKK